MQKIPYQELERHFTTPKNMPLYGEKRIPRKLKKKVRAFCGVHWNSSDSGAMLWYYLEKSNNAYSRFLIKQAAMTMSSAAWIQVTANFIERTRPKQIIKSQSGEKIYCLNPECQEEWREHKPICIEGFVNYKKLCLNCIDGNAPNLTILKVQYRELEAQYEAIPRHERDSNFGIGIYRQIKELRERIKKIQNEIKNCPVKN